MHVLINEPVEFPAAALAQLRQTQTVHIAGEEYPCAEVECAFVRLSERIGPEFHCRHPKLRWVVSPTTGLNHLDIDYLGQHGIRIISLKGETAFLDGIRATAEHTIALLLALLRKLPAAHASVLDGVWNRDLFRGREIAGSKVFVIGYGRLGRQLHQLYTAFGAQVRAYDIQAGRVPDAIRVELEAGLAWADITSVHVSLEPDNHGFLHAGLLGLMRADAVLVNTSRGELIDQRALLDQVAAGRLAGAALDVLWDEPAPLRPDLLALMQSCGDRLVLTPHIGGNTVESRAAVELFVTMRFLEALDEA